MENLTPKGILIPIGGSEDREAHEEFQERVKAHKLDFITEGVLSTVVSLMKNGDENKELHIEVITTASGIPKEIGDDYVYAFKLLGCDVNLMHIRTAVDTLEKDYIDRVKKADGLFFTGGDQSRISRAFLDSELLDIIRDRYMNEHFVIAGTSAGAMMMSEYMIKGGNSGRAMYKGEIEMGKGLGFLEDVIVDSHFMKRGRIGRLMHGIGQYPGKLGLGVAEDTGAVIRDGHKVEIIGSGHVIILESDDMDTNNFSETRTGKPFSMGNLRLNALANGMKFDFKTRKVVG